MNFHFVPVEGGWSWEWEHGDLKYQAVSLDGSSYLFLYVDQITDPDEWVFRFKRSTKGRSARSVAHKIYNDVIEGKHSG